MAPASSAAGLLATGTFDSLAAEGTRPGGDWNAMAVGGDDRPDRPDVGVHAGG